MDNIALVLEKIPQRKKKNENWELASELSKITGTDVRRWLRYTSKNRYAVDRAMIDFKELFSPTKIKSKSGFMAYLIKKYL